MAHLHPPYLPLPPYPPYPPIRLNGNDNNDANSDNIIFTIKCTKLYVPVVILSTKENEELTKLLSEEFERSVY